MPGYSQTMSGISLWKRDLLTEGEVVSASHYSTRHGLRVNFEFSSSQYFATVFRKYEGLSPSDFLIRIKGGEVS